jgi:hypothetical protein
LHKIVQPNSKLEIRGIGKAEFLREPCAFYWKHCAALAESKKREEGAGSRGQH